MTVIDPLDRLDFQPRCDLCRRPARWTRTCTDCGRVWLACRGHRHALPAHRSGGRPLEWRPL